MKNKTPALSRPILVAMLGIALESYNVVLYGYFATLLSPLYFPAESAMASSLLAMGAFAISFVMRPVGGLIFGYLGDRVSRKLAMLASVLLMSCSTLLIALLPDYFSIGLWAPSLLILALFFQGMCAGGAYSTAAIFVNEHAKRGYQGFVASLINSSGICGAVLVTCIGCVITQEGLPTWIWRLPFVLGGLMGFAIYAIRQSAQESPAFQKAQKTPVHSLPFFEILKNRKLNMLSAMGIGACSFIPYHTVSVFMNMLLNTRFSVAPGKVLMLNMLTMILWVLFLPLMGLLSDRIGHRRLMSFAALGTVAFAGLGILGMFHEIPLSFLELCSIQLTLSLLGAAFTAPSSAFITQLFRVSERCSGLGVCYFLGVALFGGTAPLFNGLLMEWTGSVLSPAIYLAFGGFLGWISVKSAQILPK